MPTDHDPTRSVPTGAHRAPLRPLLLIGVGAAIIRVVYTLALARHVDLGVSDATFYSAAANHLAEGDGFIDIWRSLAEGTTMQTAHHPPGWPALLSVSSLLGVESELGHRLVGAVLGGAVVVLLGLLAWRVAGRRAGLLAGGVGAVHPTLVAADGSLMPETLAGAIVLLIVLGGVWTLAAPTPGRALALGLAIGAGALVRGEALLYVVLVALPVAVLAARRSPDAVWTFLRIGVPAAVGVVAIVLPWTVRNTLLFDEPVLISINDSTVLAGANCDPAYEEPGIGSWHIGCIQHTGGSEVEEAEVWRAQGLEYLRENVDRLPAVIVARTMRTWGVRDVFPPVAEGRHTGTQSIGNVVWLAFLLPGAVAGVAVLARRRHLAALGLLLAPVAAATAVSVLGFGMLRFRHPMELAATVLTAIAVAELLGRRTRDADGAPAEPALVST